MKFNKKEFISYFIKRGGITFFDKSALSQYTGKPSTVYFNWRTLSENVESADKCANFIIKFVLENNINPDCFVGVPEGTTKLAPILQYKWVKEYKKGRDILPSIRVNDKDHGSIKDRSFLVVPSGKIVLVEDIVVKGESLKRILNRLEKAKITPYAIIVLSTRMKPRYYNSFIKFLKKRNIKLYSLSEEKEVVEEAVKILKPSEEIIKDLRERGKID